MELFENTTLGTKTLKNRIFRSATNEHLAEADGRLSEYMLQAYEDLAAGGVGSIITGHYAVQSDARVGMDQPIVCVQDPAVLKEAADRVHAHGANLIMQLSHGGLKASETVNGRPNRGPKDFTVEELQELCEAFVKGARMAKDAGFDGVQVHLAHGYLLSSFVDPFENTRKDAYGGDVEGRLRLPCEIIRAIRETCGEDFLILVKVNCDASQPMDYVPVLRQVLELCKAAGIDAAEISGLAFSAQRADRDEPYFLKEVAAVREGLDLPLILVGGLDSMSKMQQVLDAGIPYVSLSRSLICQPDFVNRIQDGAETSPCIRCFGCFRVFKTRMTRCVLHKEMIPLFEKNYGRR